MDYGDKSTVIREALHLLTLAGLVVPVIHSNANRCFDSSGRRHIVGIGTSGIIVSAADIPLLPLMNIE